MQICVDKSQCDVEKDVEKNKPYRKNTNLPKKFNK